MNATPLQASVDNHRILFTQHCGNTLLLSIAETVHIIPSDWFQLALAAFPSMAQGRATAVVLKLKE